MKIILLLKFLAYTPSRDDVS